MLSPSITVHFVTPLFHLIWGIVTMAEIACSLSGWLPDFRAKMHPARNSGGYPIFEPERILLKIRVGPSFLPMVPEWMVRGGISSPIKDGLFSGISSLRC